MGITIAIFFVCLLLAVIWFLSADTGETDSSKNFYRKYFHVDRDASWDSSGGTVLDAGCGPNTSNNWVKPDKYWAEVLCNDTGFKTTITADTLSQLGQQIEETFNEWYEDAIRREEWQRKQPHFRK